ncbi:MAG: DNA polymerase I [Parcubacteria group bacterium LiPW_15]|nr:MAG: DNA polymerase I [Parcubacteria group bacterium LiPW_15]
MKKLLLIDANSLIHRAFHALPPMTAPDGSPSQAIYGVSRILLKLWREEKPDYAAALFDRPEPTFRDELYKDYKGNRPETADELISQLIEIHNLFPLFGIKVFEKPGYEADDLIATLAKKFGSEKETETTIFTGDLDSLQLVNKKVSVRVPQKGISETTIYDPEAVRERYGLYPKSIADYKSLVGDNSDNIKGVPGIGPKTAAKLLQKYGSLAKLLAAKNDEEVSKKIIPHKEQALLAEKLVTLQSDAQLGIKGLGDLTVFEDETALKNYFAAKGFGSLLKQMSATPKETPQKEKEADRQASFF